jgi:hypothetical protein
MPVVTPDACPFCGRVLKPRPCGRAGWVTCPRCGQRLLFLSGRSAAWFFRGSAGWAEVIPALADLQGCSELALDSLDVVELAMELDEQSPGVGPPASV